MFGDGIEGSRLLEEEEEEEVEGSLGWMRGGLRRFFAVVELERAVDDILEVV